ncbi:MAG: hypothetical protein IT384_17615 [Deltaproteobacteria bacterium]|nr:hypothetical protein [Deltaproteobacteria bacterium]
MSAALLILTAASLASTAPRPAYGGEVTTSFVGESPSLDPTQVRSLAALSVSAALFERLFRVEADGSITPELASGLPVARGSQAIIPIRRNVRLHDGRLLEPEDVARALRAFKTAGFGAEHLVLPIEGARTTAPLSVTVLADELAIAVRLTHPYDLTRLWARGESAIAVPRSGPGPTPVGTGPFRVAEPPGDTALTLVPFTGHRRGRPFFDRWVVRAVGSTFATGELLRPGRGAIAFDPVEPEVASRMRALDGRAGAPPLDLFYLAVGRARPELTTTALLRSMEAVIDRDRLVRRYVRGRARSARSITGLDPEAGLPPLRSSARARVTATLLLADQSGPERRFAERLQLDLLRAGVTATLKLLDDRELRRRQRSGDFDLLLGRFFLEGEVRDDALHHLHGLLAFAASLGRGATAVSAEELARFGAPTPAQEEELRRLVLSIDRRLRDDALVVPLVHQLPSAYVGGAVIGVEADARGAVLLENGLEAEERSP